MGLITPSQLNSELNIASHLVSDNHQGGTSVKLTPNSKEHSAYTGVAVPRSYSASTPLSLRANTKAQSFASDVFGLKAEESPTTFSPRSLEAGDNPVARFESSPRVVTRLYTPHELEMFLGFAQQLGWTFRGDMMTSQRETKVLFFANAGGAELSTLISEAQNYGKEVELDALKASVSTETEQAVDSFIYGDEFVEFSQKREAVESKLDTLLAQLTEEKINDSLTEEQYQEKIIELSNRKEQNSIASLFAQPALPNSLVTPALQTQFNQTQQQVTKAFQKFKQQLNVLIHSRNESEKADNNQDTSERLAQWNEAIQVQKQKETSRKLLEAEQQWENSLGKAEDRFQERATLVAKSVAPAA